MSHWMFSCKEVSQKVSESMDRKLPVYHRMLITMHLLMCKYCSRFKNQLLILRNAVNQEYIPEDKMDAFLPEKTRERIKKTLRKRLNQSD